MHPRTSELLAYLDAQRAVLAAAVDAVPADARDRAPAEGRWSAAGVVEHLAIVTGRVAERLGHQIAEARAKGLAAETATDPLLPALGLDRVVERTKKVHAPDAAHPTGLRFDAAWSALARAGESARAALRAADGLALGSLSMPHPIFGPLSFYEWFAFLGGHEARHAAQIREDYGV